MQGQNPSVAFFTDPPHMDSRGKTWSHLGPATQCPSTTEWANSPRGCCKDGRCSPAIQSVQPYEPLDRRTQPEPGVRPATLAQPLCSGFGPFSAPRGKARVSPPASLAPTMQSCGRWSVDATLLRWCSVTSADAGHRVAPHVCTGALRLTLRVA